MSRASIWYNGTNGYIEPLEAAVAALEEPVPPAIPIPKTKQAESEALYYMLRQPPKPPMCYRCDSNVPPGYRLCDIKKYLHPDDYKAFIRDVKPCGKLDGEPIVWALDYVQWVIHEEER